MTTNIDFIHDKPSGRVYRLDTRTGEREEFSNVVACWEAISHPKRRRD